MSQAPPGRVFAGHGKDVGMVSRVDAGSVGKIFTKLKLAPGQLIQSAVATIKYSSLKRPCVVELKRVTITLG